MVAAGAAKIGEVSELDSPVRVCTSCGAYHANETATSCPNCNASAIAVLDTCLSRITSHPRPSARLVLVMPAGEEEIREIQHDRFRIGRNSQSEWVIDPLQYRTVSSAHAVITWEDDHFLLSDLDTPNGTWVNGERIKQCVIQHGDEILLSQSGPKLRFEVEL